MEIIQNFFEWLEDFNAVSVAVRLVCATLMGALIGMERATKKRSAGLRTFALVCLGAALTMVVNEYMYEKYNYGDPVRLAAQVISGIGFLGMGTIVVTGKNQVKGLTTAATLWVTGALGICVGSGYVMASIYTFVLMMIIIKVLAFVSRFWENHTREVELYVEVKRESGIKEVMEQMKGSGYKIVSMEKMQDKTLFEDTEGMAVELDLGKKMSHEVVIGELSELSSVKYVEEID